MGPKIPILFSRGMSRPKGMVCGESTLRTKVPIPGQRSKSPAISNSRIARATVGRDAPNSRINCTSVGTWSPGTYTPRRDRGVDMLVDLPMFPAIERLRFHNNRIYNGFAFMSSCWLENGGE